MSAGEAVEIVGGGFEGLVRAAELTRTGARVDIREPALRAGGAYVTESFLTPFRFNLGPALVRRPPVSSLRVLEPDPVLRVGSVELGREPIALTTGTNVRETLDASGVADAGRRAALTALALLLGIDPHASGSGAALTDAGAGLPELVAVEGGNGLAVAALIDEIVAGGGRVYEGVGPQAPPRRHEDALGVCRLFVGLRSEAAAPRAFATALGFDDEASLDRRLRELRGGGPIAPVGFVLQNTHLDPRRPGDPLSSFVWQGILPTKGERLSRRAYTAAVLDAVGVENRDVVFRLLWLPDETGEVLSAPG